MNQGAPTPPLDRATIRRLVEAALVEDGAADDLTTAALVPPDQHGEGHLIAETAGVICGLDFVAETFAAIEPSLRWRPALRDGDTVAAGVCPARVVGPLHAILRGERVALNFLQRLSGIATMTRRAVAAVAGTGVVITDTRKTTPGLRGLEKYAVRVGGGENHRASLADAVLWKDNHWELLGNREGRGLAELCGVLSGLPDLPGPHRARHSRVHLRAAGLTARTSSRKARMPIVRI